MKKRWIIMTLLIFTIIVTTSGSTANKTPNEVQQEKSREKLKENRKKSAESENEGKKEEKNENSEKNEKIIVIPTMKRNDEAVKEENPPAPKAQDTGTAPVTNTDDVSDGSKFKTYNNYEDAALAKKNSNTIYQLSQLYFKDGLYERAVNLSKKDISGDIRNLYMVAIGSRLMGNYDQSIEYYNRILATSPDQREAKLGIGVAYKAKGDFSKALGYLREYSKTNSDSEVIKEIAVLNELISSK